jgi:hypothetical protein
MSLTTNLREDELCAHYGDRVIDRLPEFTVWAVRTIRAEGPC